MEKKGTSVFSNSLIWFGAGVSIAEIVTGTYLASLGMTKGILATVIGHIIGCVLLFLAGIIGAKTKKSSMETVKISFGQKGSIIFSALNVIQLAGWTAIMIYDGAISANGIFNTGKWVWCLVIGVLIILWIIVGISNVEKINVVAMSALFILTIILCKVVFFDNHQMVSVAGDGLTFGAAVELAVAMPLSWLPLISDYTREAEKPVKATAASAIVYGLVSCWMYIIGMGAAIYTQDAGIDQIMLKAGLGIAGLLIIVFSTVTTTYLDAYSAGISSETISHKIKGKYMAIAVTIVGTIAAIVYPMDDITDFLYLIGSVFAPMIAIQIADFFIIKKDSTEKNVEVANVVIWIIGFVLYRYLMTVDIIVGNTLPDMVITVIICVIVSKLELRMQNNNIVEITDFESKELDIYARCNEPELLRGFGRDGGIFIAESPKVVERALDAGYQPISMLVEHRHIDGEAKHIIKRCGSVPVYTAEFDVLSKITGFKLTRGMLCAMHRTKLKTIEEVCAGAKRIAILENVMNPTNIGAIFRSAAALGMDAVLMTPGCSNPLYRRAIRVSMGTVFQIPWTFFDGELK